jgi:APA family basic amino acid/polyamine antiporter
MMAGGIFLLRRRPGYAPTYRVWGYPWVPAVFVAASATIVVNRLVAEPNDSLVGLAIVGLGVPAYYTWRYATRGRLSAAEAALARNAST